MNIKNMLLTHGSNTYNTLSELDKLFSKAINKNSDLEIPLEIFEKDSSWLIKAYVPGINKEDIHVDVVHGKLTISAIRHKPEDKLYLSEIEYGKLEASVKLVSMSYIEKDMLSAKHENGVLYITVQKPSNSLPYQIEIE
jgi:HSP20 family protein